MKYNHKNNKNKLDLSDTVEATDKVDLSQTQPIPVIIQQPVIKHRTPKWVKYLIIACLSVAGISLTGLAVYSQTEQPTNVKVVKTKSSNREQLDEKAFTAELKKIADATGTPYEVKTEVIGGGYVLGITTYNPDKVSELYVDYALHKPKKAVKQATDDKAKAIVKSFTDTLPTINKSIKVKDKSKVKMEIYKVDTGYQTVLLYNDKPCAYINTDNNGISTNFVTAYYVTDVAAE